MKKRRRWHWAWPSFCFVLAMPLICIEAADEQTTEGASGLTADSAQVDSGYLFVDGEYLSPPYVITETEQGLLLNGVPMTAEIPRLAGAGPGSGRFVPGRRNGREGSPGSRGPFLSPQSRLVHRLRSDSIIVAFQGRPLVIISSGGNALQFLKVIADPDPNTKVFREVLDLAPDAEDRDLWMNWLGSYRPPDDLLQRAMPVIEAAKTAESINTAQVAAVRRIDNVSYALTVLGMVLAVLSSGHLLSSLPARPEEDALAHTSSKVIRAALFSVGLILSLSSLDLVWTILAAQAGQMRELNPLGNGLIDDPKLLIGFKSLATFLSCGVLMALRRHHIARLAAWWICLVCTILTFRWLLFNSMFMGS